MTHKIDRDILSGLLLIFATLSALILQNSPLSTFYTNFLHTPVELSFGQLHLAKPLLLWVNDGLMAIFFFLIGLEVKREVLEGELSSLRKIALPGIAALGGMTVPAVIYLSLNAHDDFSVNGWAIPTATDIAFALGILSLLGSRIPRSAKLFLMALAIIDDLGAIIIIALFYTDELSSISLIVATSVLVGLILLNRMGVNKKTPYIILGTILWVSVLKSGVHATLAGVALAFTIPMYSNRNTESSIAYQMEHDLQDWVSFFILPLFAFVNAGIDLHKVSLDALLLSAPLGIMMGLFLGKQLGVFGFTLIATKLKIIKIPKSIDLLMLYGISVLTGIGFTMSLFIDTLAFNDTVRFNYADKLAILLGSLFSALLGFTILKIALHRRKSRL